MGLVTEYYLSSALEKLERGSHKLDSFWEDSTARDYLEAALNPDFHEGEPVDYQEDEDSEIREGVIEDTRPLLNLATGLHPDSDRTYKIEDRGRTITVSEDDILYERSNT